MEPTTTQRCPRCALDLPLDAYPPSYRGKRGTRCSACHTEYCRAQKAGELKPRVICNSYAAAHARVRYWRGSASTHLCVGCGAPAREWAYDHADPEEWEQERNGSLLVYSLDIERYQPMCKLCHNAFDGKVSPDRYGS